VTAFPSGSRALVRCLCPHPLLDEIAASHGSKVPPRHESWMGDLIESAARNIGKIWSGEQF
jgi:hypothetical protein